MSKQLPYNSEWNFDLLERYDAAIGEAANEFQLDTYPNRIEIITAEQMLDAYASVGMPLYYHHWSFGKHFLNAEKSYRHGHIDLAYEVVINSNPCIAYLMEGSNMTMQATVMAHACYGHNSFFKGNYLFNTWTNPDFIIDYLVFARKFITECEEKHGIDAVEKIIDACHALSTHGVDRYKRPQKLSLEEEMNRQEERDRYLQSRVNDLWRTVPGSKHPASHTDEAHFPEEPEENILFFMEKHAPLLEPWQREIIRIVRKITQYFYPQRQTKIMNEGWACFWHYTLINKLYDNRLLSDEFMLEFLKAHTDVICQPDFDTGTFGGLNPYNLGFKIYNDIRRICENPTDEDKQYFPDLVGQPWLSAVDAAMRNFKDESFIAQYLSPHLIREMHLFCIRDDDRKPEYEVTAIHNREGYDHIREALSNQFNLSETEPNIQIYNVNLRTDRALTLRHVQHNNKKLAEDTQEVLLHLYNLWGFPIHLETVDSRGNLLRSYHYPDRDPVKL